MAESTPKWQQKYITQRWIFILLISHRSTLSMMTSSNGNIFRVTGPLWEESTGHRSFDVFFDLRLNKRLSKQRRRQWFETPSRSLWRHCYVPCQVSVQTVPEQQSSGFPLIAYDWICFHNDHTVSSFQHCLTFWLFIHHWRFKRTWFHKFVIGYCLVYV